MICRTDRVIESRLAYFRGRKGWVAQAIFLFSYLFAHDCGARYVCSFFLPFKMCPGIGACDCYAFWHILYMLSDGVPHGFNVGGHGCGRLFRLASPVSVVSSRAQRVYEHMLCLKLQACMPSEAHLSLSISCDTAFSVISRRS